MVWSHLSPVKSLLVVVVSGEWQTKFSVSPGPGLWSLVLGAFGPDLGPDLDLTWDLDLSLTILYLAQRGRGCNRGRGPGPRGGRPQPPQAPGGRGPVHRGDPQVGSRQDPEEGSQGGLSSQNSVKKECLLNIYCSVHFIVILSKYFSMQSSNCISTSLISYNKILLEFSLLQYYNSEILRILRTVMSW